MVRALAPRGDRRLTTTIVFVLLALTVTLSTATVFGSALVLTTHGRIIWRQSVQCMGTVRIDAPAAGLTGLPALNNLGARSKTALSALQTCAAVVEHEEFSWLLGGIGAVLLMALVFYLLHLALLARLYRLRPPHPEDSAFLLAELERLRVLAGVRPLSYRLRPFDAVPSAFVLGLPGKRCLVLSGGLVVRLVTDPPAFRAVVLHELSHLRNRDIDFTYGALALTSSFALVAGGMAVTFGVDGIVNGGAPGSEIAALPLRVAGLLVTVLVLTAVLVRAREFHADARVLDWGEPGSALHRVLAAMPVPARLRLSRVHPSPAARLAALAGAIPLFGDNLAGGIGLGLVAGVGGFGLSQVGFAALTDTTAANWVSTATGALLGVAVVAGRLRTAPATGSPGAGRRRSDWWFGTGLSAGLALGPLLWLGVYSTGVAALLMWLVLWVPLTVLPTGPVTVWIIRGTGAACAQMRRGGIGARTEWAVRTVIAGAACAAYGVVVRAIETGFQVTLPYEGERAGAVASRLLSPLTLWGLLLEAEAIPALLVCVAVAVLIGTVVLYRTRQGGVRQSDTVRGALWGLTGGAAVLLFVMLASWEGQRQPLLYRWSNVSYLRFSCMLMACCDVGVLLVALLAAGRPRGALVRGGVAALVSGVVATTAVLLQPFAADCLPRIAVRPDSPACFSTYPTAGYLNTTTVWVLGASLTLCVVMIPHALALRRWARWPWRRAGKPVRRSQSAWRAWTASLIALGMVFFAGRAVAVSTLKRPSLAGASIGNGGWIGARDYRLRLIPGWFNLPVRGNSAGSELILRPEPVLEDAEIDVIRESTPSFDAERNSMLRRGGHSMTIAGHPAAALTLSVLAGFQGYGVLVADGSTHLSVILQARPDTAEWSQAQSDLKRLLKTWQWRETSG
ncbi:MAG: M48 family metalloprotease [Streptomycetaceae bacterium]|nr:M48 family metalloprotease [Streptomycetaceae bacterium]